MNRKKVALLIGGICLVVAIALLVIKVAIPASKRVKREPTPTIPAVIPQGSVVVWRRTATIFSKNGSAEYYLDKYQYDEYGRCIVNTHYDPEGGSENTLYEYDEATHHTMECVVRRDGDIITEKRAEVYNEKGDKVGVVMWRHNGEKLVKTYETVYEKDAFGNDVLIADIGYNYDGSVSSLVWTVYKEESRWLCRQRYTNFGKLSGNNGDWRAIADAAEDSDSELEAITEYDEQGRVTREFKVLDNGECFLTEKTEYHEGKSVTFSYFDDGHESVAERDDEGRIILRVTKDEFGVALSRSESTYEELPSGGYREAIETKYLDGSGPNYGGAYEYNANGDLVKKTFWNDEVGEMIDTLNTYDDQGRLVKRERPEYKEVWTFDYDEYGNLIKMTGKSEDWGTETEEFINAPFVLEEEKVKEGESYFCPLYLEP
ncbi:MAG: RHS repeat protein [Lachnospiraceae bacterium]|nr:RHS repeat protein [Lachnospiraceae bacterium]